MAFELSKELLGQLVIQQRQQQFQMQTPQWQAAMDQLFANRIEFAQNQLLKERIAAAENPAQLLEAIKTVAPEYYMKRMREQNVQSQIFGLMSTVPEEERDYGMINFLASTVGWGDVGPIAQRPMTEERLRQEIKLRTTAPYDRYGIYLGRPSTAMRQQREREYKDMLESGILYQGQPATEEQRGILQRQYLEQGTIPEQFSVKPKEVRPIVPQRPTKAIMDEADKQAKLLIGKEEEKLQKAGVKSKSFLWWGLDEDDTLDNLKALPPEELEKLDISPELKDLIKLFQKYGRAKDYVQYGTEYIGEYIKPDQEIIIDPTNPAGLPLPPLPGTK